MSIDGLQELVQSLDKETMLSCQNVSRWVQDYLAYVGQDSLPLLQAASIYDVGKMYVSSRILYKKDHLTATEMQIIRLHPYMGWLTAKEYGVSDEVADIVLYHHGRSPLHLQEIPLPTEDTMRQARILYTFDAYHAMTSDRCYRKAMEPRKALEIMREECHGQMIFDGNVMEFLRYKTYRK